MPAKQIVIVGYGTAGREAELKLQTVAAAASLAISITVIHPTDFVENTYAMVDIAARLDGPGRMATTVLPTIAAVGSTKASTSFVKGLAKSIDAAASTITYKLPTGTDTATISYDALIVASGVAYDGIRPDLSAYDAADISAADVGTASRRTAELKTWHDDHFGADKKKIVIVGGGVLGIELAMVAKEEVADREVTLVHSGNSLLSGATKSFAYAGTTVEAMLAKRGIEVKLGTRASGDAPTVTLTAKADGTTSTVTVDSIVFTGAGAPHTSFLPANFVDAKGFVLVDQHLQSPIDSKVWSYGDVAATGLTKHGMAAAVNGGIIAGNIVASLSSDAPTLTPFVQVEASMFMVLSNSKDYGVCIASEGSKCKGLLSFCCAWNGWTAMIPCGILNLALCPNACVCKCPAEGRGPAEFHKVRDGFLFLLSIFALSLTPP